MCLEFEIMIDNLLEQAKFNLFLVFDEVLSYCSKKSEFSSLNALEESQIMLELSKRPRVGFSPEQFFLHRTNRLKS